MIAVRKRQLSWFAKHNISLLMLFYLAASEILNKYAFWMLLAVSAVYFVFRNGGRITVKDKKSILVFIAMFVIGFFSSLLTMVNESVSVGAWTYLRDMIRMSAIPLACIVCINLSGQERHDRKVLYSTIFFFCSVYGIGSMLISIPSYMASAESLFSFAGNLIDQWIAAVGVFLAFCKPPCIEKYYVGRWFDLIAKVGLPILAVISFSRTVFVLLLCLLLPFFCNRLTTLLKVLVIIALAVMIVWNVFHDVATTFSDKVLRSFTEMSSASSNWDSWSVVNNWRGYEVYCAQDEFANYNLLEKIFGKGFGATVDAKGYANLVTSEDSLPYLHNGYYTTLIKMGIVGVALNIGYWIMLFLERKKRMDRFDYKTCIGVILAMASSMLVIHGIFWGGVLFIPFLLLEWD